MKTLVIDAQISGGAYILREFDGAAARLVGNYSNLNAACAHAQAWSDRLADQDEPCRVVYINPEGESKELPTFSRTITVPIDGCTLMTAQLENLAAEFFGHVRDGEVHFTEKKFAEAFASTLGVPLP